ncbi:MAG: hypothetical protein ACYDBA_13975 [Sulfuricaulis sp.]
MSVDDIYSLANWILVATLVVGVAATYAIVVTGKIRDAALRRELAAQGAIAAQANARSAELEKETADARLETERIKEAVAWRILPSENASELEKVLAAKPGSVNLRYTDGDPEALYLAVQISQILTKAHWQIAPGAVKPSNVIVFGIGLPDATGVDAQTLRKAFSEAKVAFATTPIPESGVSFNVSTIPGAPILMVGSKRPVLP